MALEPLRDLPRRLHHLTDPAGDGGLSDAHLLERFVTCRDEAAFEVLVWRHGAMVLGVCRRLLRDEHDAEDAFQAAFLVLVRKAASIRKRTAVASWLYKVAYRVSLEARALAKYRAAKDGMRVMAHSQPRKVSPGRSRWNLPKPASAAAKIS
jgi:DNA-directed RNA polymerase specialized sigma24 family protein